MCHSINLEKCKKECNILFKLFWYKVVHRKLRLLNLLVEFVLSLELSTGTKQTGPGIFIAEVFLLARDWVRMCLKDNNNNNGSGLFTESLFSQASSWAIVCVIMTCTTMQIFHVPHKNSERSICNYIVLLWIFWRMKYQ